MPTNTSGGTTTSFNNTPQAVDDSGSAYENYVFCFDVMANDLGGAAKILWSIDDSDTDGTTSAGGTGDGTIDLLSKDNALIPELSDLGARIWIEAGKIKYDTNTLDWLAAGQTVTDLFTYAIRMSNGTLSWATVTVTVVGRNDGPVITSAVQTGAVTEKAEPGEGGSLSSTGTITFSDADLTDTHSASVSVAVVDENGDPVPSPLGTLAVGVLDQVGNSVGWTYSIDDSALDYLADGETLTQVYTVVVTDNNGLSASQTVTVTITGTNDAPVLTVDAAGAVTEDGANPTLTASGALSISDVDATDTHDVIYAYNGDAAWSGGSLSDAQKALLADGFDASVTGWTYDIANAAVQFLDSGETITLSFTVTASDDSGTANDSDSEVVTITINGANDAPVVTGVTAATDEDTAYVGQVTGTDVDDEPLTYALAPGQALPAGVTFNSNGTFTVAPLESDQGLDTDESRVVSFQVVANDGTVNSAPQTVTVKINGVNDAPVAQAFSGATDEDNVFNGQLVATDVDVETLTYTVAPGGTLPPGVVLNSDGSFSVTPLASDQGLDDGESRTVTFSYVANDGTVNSAPQTVTVKINGVNDAPEVATEIEDQSVDEDNLWTFAVPAATFSDVDVEDLALSATLGDGSDLPGWLLFDASTGTFSGTPPLNFHGTISLKVTASDGDLSVSDTFDLVVNPVNDAPVNAVPGAKSVDEDGTLAIGGVTVGDVDSANLSTTLTVAHGALTVAAVAGLGIAGNGSGSVVLTGTQAQINTALASLTYAPAANYNGSDTLEVSTTDGFLTDTDSVAITVNPVNDAPTATNLNAAETYTEDTPLNLTDILVSDVDNASLAVTLTLSNPAAGALSTGTVGAVTSTYNAATGVWTASGAIADVNALLAGLVFSPAPDFNGNLTIATSVSDGIAPPVTGTKVLTGIAVNDAPVVDLNGVPAGNDVTVTFLEQTPVRIAPSGTIADVDSANMSSLTATLTSRPDGNSTESLALNAAALAAAAGAGLAVSYDSSTGVLSITGSASKATYETILEGILYSNGSDTPTTTPRTVIVVVNDGSDNSANYTSTINITPLNDAPVLTGIKAVLAAGTEDTAYTIYESDLLAGYTDVDGGDLRVSSLTAVNGILTDNLDGTWTFVPTINFNGTVTLNYSVVDGHGGLVSASNSFTLAPVNDPAHFAGQDVGELTEDDSVTVASGQLFAVDPDAGESSFQPQSNVAGICGTFAITASGAWTYTLDNADSDTNGLDDGEVVTDSFTVASLDGTTTSITVTVNGADDAPTLAPVASGSIAEVANSTGTIDGGLNGVLSGEDVDGDALTYGISGGTLSDDGLTVSKTGTYGTLTVTLATGAYFYAKNDAAIEALSDGQTPSDVFTMTVSDGDGPTVDQTYNVNLTGADETVDVLAPTDIKFSLDETSANNQGSNLGSDDPLGTFTAVDPDSTSWTFQLGGTHAGLFAIDPDTGVLSVGSSNIGSGTYTITVSATDGAGNTSAPETYTIWVGTTGPNGTTGVPILISSGSDIDFGLNGSDVIFGGGGDDALVGGQNGDTLNGGLGNDELLGGGGNDNFRFQYDGTTTNLAQYGVDKILDMNAEPGDRIELDDALFAGIGTAGSLNNAAFKLDGSPVDATDRIIYNSVTGALYYDADGSGGASAAVQFAQLDSGTSLTLSDFFVI